VLLEAVEDLDTGDRIATLQGVDEAFDASRIPPAARRAMSASALGSIERPSVSRMCVSLPSISGIVRRRTSYR
jgi:hypothetical protein